MISPSEGKKESSVEPMNPLGLMEVEDLSHAGNFLETSLRDIKLLPENCVEIYNHLQQFYLEKNPKILSPKLATKLEKLKPEIFFSEFSAKFYNLSMKDATSYETHLKELLYEISKEDSAHLQALLRDFDFSTQEKLFTVDLVPILQKLNQGEKLPIIIFIDDRTECENVFQKIVFQLAANENEIRIKENVNSKLFNLKHEIDQMQKIAKPWLDDVPPEKWTETQKDYYDRLMGKKFELEKISDRDPRCVFLPTSDPISEEELKSEYLKNDPRHVSKMQWDGLLRGVAVHHPGLPKKYRRTVEILFRMKKILVNKKKIFFFKLIFFFFFVGGNFFENSSGGSERSL